MNRGFTIIELVVVIAIIAVLAGIVLVNVMQYISKGKDAAIKAQVGQIRTAATVFFADKNTYANMCASGTDCYNTRSNINKIATGSLGDNIAVSADAYCMDFNLSSCKNCWCIDSTSYIGPQDSCTSIHYSCN